VKVANYPLIYRGGLWRLDREAFAAAISPKTRAIIGVSPNNPTGSFLCEADAAFIKKLAAEHGLAIICDEVFADYGLSPAPDAVRTLAGATEGPLTFTLSGLSKVVGLPQMKLGWITVGGEASLVKEACARLEMIADTFLSVGTPIQNACAGLLAKRGAIQEQILARVKTNLTVLGAAIASVKGLELMAVEGGWYAILEAVGVADEETFALKLLKERNVLVHPGYYYGFDSGAHFVLGLLTEEKAFDKGMASLVDYYRSNSSC
jgi:alanine-synthesizing transaminase